MRLFLEIIDGKIIVKVTALGHCSDNQRNSLQELHKLISLFSMKSTSLLSFRVMSVYWFFTF